MRPLKLGWWKKLLILLGFQQTHMWLSTMAIILLWGVKPYGKREGSFALTKVQKLHGSTISTCLLKAYNDRGAMHVFSVSAQLLIPLQSVGLIADQLHLGDPVRVIACSCACWRNRNEGTKETQDVYWVQGKVFYVVEVHLEDNFCKKQSWASIFGEFLQSR